jgi:hypothetical protein
LISVDSATIDRFETRPPKPLAIFSVQAIEQLFAADSVPQKDSIADHSRAGVTSAAGHFPTHFGRFVPNVKRLASGLTVATWAENLGPIAGDRGTDQHASE